MIDLICSSWSILFVLFFRLVLLSTTSPPPMTETLSVFPRKFNLILKFGAKWVHFQKMQLPDGGSQLQDDIIDIIAMNASGLWRGACAGRVGNFKFVVFLSFFVGGNFQRFTICPNCRSWSDNVFNSDLSTLRSCLHGNDGGAEAEVWDESKEDRGLSQKSCGWADDGDYDDADDDNDDYGEAILELGWSTFSKLIYIVDELMKRW